MGNNVKTYLNVFDANVLTVASVYKIIPGAEKKMRARGAVLFTGTKG